eukprot:scaffold86_cov338-Pavlova_lutheri.AAC.15
MPVVYHGDMQWRIRLFGCVLRPQLHSSSNLKDDGRELVRLKPPQIQHDTYISSLHGTDQSAILDKICMREQGDSTCMGRILAICCQN